ncbi:Zinc finger MYM-type protein 1 [Folsomia candida]|uniref:Zinc finger MYM-type protein 1 n=1 Tax=Folsomia candida TaxID=158441 RepID=A0A226DE12_FOLCA|nr:Zinc finger MYM-type protein 1 [Folsomia candida]
MSDKTPGAYKHLCGNDKRKKKLKEDEDSAKLAEKSAKFFKNFKARNAGDTGLEAVDERGIRTDDNSQFQRQKLDLNQPSTSTFVPIYNTSDGYEIRAENHEVVNFTQHSEVSTQLESGGPTIPENDSNQVNPKAEDGNFHADAQTADQDIILDDPALWPTPINSASRRYLVTKGPVAVINDLYPKRDGESFDARYFQMSHNGIYHRREWLLYSRSQNSLFCFPCSIFGTQTMHRSPFQLSASNKTGYTDFHHKGRSILSHEGTQQHFSSTASWKSFQKNMKSSTLIDAMTEKQLKSEISFWKQVLKGILSAIIFLAKNNLALRGSSTNVLDHNCGNFLSLIKLLGNYYPPLTMHLERLKKNSTSYLSPKIQNEFITQCGNWVRETILEEIRNAKYFSIIIDSTPDSSRQEQITEVIRIVKCSKKECVVKEYFIDFIASEEKTGNGLSTVVVQKLEKDKLDIKNCRGQGYDNGANMAGAYKGVQSWISKISPKAQFIPCAAHSLNLVGVNAVERVLQAKLSLGQIQTIFIFFHASTQRWKLLNTKLNCNLKGHSTTRWSSRAESVQALSTQYWNVVEALVEITTSDTFNSDSVAGADSILNIMLTFRFLLSLKIWHQILHHINICNLTLQKGTNNLDLASKKLEALLSWLKEFRLSGFEECLSDSCTLAKQYDIDTTTGFMDKRKTRGIKRKRLEELSEDAAKELTNFERFKLEFFNELMDNLISEIGSRFGQLRSCNQDFGFLWGVGLAAGSNDSFKQRINDLCEKYEGDFDQIKFINEMNYVKHQISSLLPNGRDIYDTCPVEVLEIIYEHDLQSCFPNVACALQIFLTLPVTVSHGERSFSKLKIIKNYLRSSMGQERLSSLSILSIEHTITDTISFDEMIWVFANAKCRRVPLE